MSELLKIRKKIILLGDSQVGKTSLIRKFVIDLFDDKYIETLGTKITNKVITLNYPDKNIVVELKMLIWDLMGHGDYHLLHESAFTGSSGAILVGDLTREETLNNLDLWTSNLFGVTGQIPIIFIGNKSDLVNDNVEKPKVLQELATSFQTIFLLSSAKTGLNVESAFRVLGKNLIDSHFNEQQ